MNDEPQPRIPQGAIESAFATAATLALVGLWIYWAVTALL